MVNVLGVKDWAGCIVIFTRYFAPTDIANPQNRVAQNTLLKITKDLDEFD